MRRQRGAILFMIILAVVLFAALAYAVTSSLRGGGKSISAEKAEMLAAQIMQQAHLMEQTILRLQLTNDCADNQMSFWHDSDGDGTLETNGEDAYYNPNAPERCRVFGPEGGAMAWLDAPKDSVETPASLWMYSALPVAGVGPWPETMSSRCISQPGTIQATCRDLVMMLGRIDGTVCALISKKLGFNSIVGDNIVNLAMNSLAKFTGNYASGPDDISTPGGHLFGRAEGCFRQLSNGDADKYFYYKVLIAR